MNIEPTISDRVILTLLAIFCMGMGAFNEKRLQHGEPVDTVPSTILGLVWVIFGVLLLLEAAGLL